MQKRPIAALLILMLVLLGCSDKKDSQGLITSESPVISQTENARTSAEPSIASQSENTLNVTEQDGKDKMGSNNQQYAEGRELFALARAEDEAKNIAELYGIELVDVEYGVATFHTEENPNEVINRGKENGWPLLEINYSKQFN